MSAASTAAATTDRVPGARAGGGMTGALGPLVRLTYRGLLGRRRTLLMVLLAAAPVLVAAIIAFGGSLGDPDELALGIFARLTLGLVVPLVAVVLGTAALGTEIDDGTIVFLLVKPVPRRTVILAKMLVAAAASAALALVSALVSSLLIAGAGATGVLAGTALAAVLGAVVYGCAFVALSVFTGRALVIGLGYVLIWEGFVTSLLAGTRVLSIREYAMAVANALGGGGPGELERGAGVALPAALVLSAIVLVGAYLLASWRLRRFEVTEAG